METMMADGLSSVRSRLAASVYLPDEWKLRKVPGESEYELTDGLHVIAEFPHGMPNLMLGIAAVRENLANHARLSGAQLAEEWRIDGAPFEEEVLHERSLDLGSRLGIIHAENVQYLMGPASFSDERIIEAVREYSKERFALGFYLAGLLRHLSIGFSPYSDSALLRYPDVSLDVRTEFAGTPPLEFWSENLGIELSRIRLAELVGSEPSLGIDSLRSFFRSSSHSLRDALLDTYASPEAVLCHPGIVRAAEAFAKTLIYRYPTGGLESDYIQERVQREKGWILSLLEEGLDVPPTAMPQPTATATSVSPGEAEGLCCEWMQHLGATDAKVTQFSSDGGIDVESRYFIAQVKNYTGSVGAPEIYQFIGVATVDGRSPLFFTSGTYTRQAILAASRAKLPLLVYNATEGVIRGINRWGDLVISRGLTAPQEPEGHDADEPGVAPI